MDRAWALVAGLTAVAAALRILGLDAKGFWQDEALTANAVQVDLGAMFDQISDAERNPPLYFLVARVWAEPFGAGEVGLRSLSVLAGTLTVPVAFLAARELVSVRAGVVAAALVAVNPLLVWYSQEARSYALFVLLAALALLFFARGLRDASGLNLGLWAAFSALAAATHYFGAFPFVAEAAWLLVRHGPRRRVLIAVVVPVAAGAALLPLAFAQEGTSDVPVWIEEIGLAGRLAQIPGIFLVGFEVPFPLIVGLAAIAALLAALGLWLLVTRGALQERRGALVAGTVAGVAILLPMVLVLVGLDYLIYKNVIAAVVPLAIVVAAGFTTRRASPLGIGAAAGLVALSVGIVVATASEPKYGREAWREAASALGPTNGGRAIVATPGVPAVEPLTFVYLPGSTVVGPTAVRVSELDVLALPRRGLGEFASAELPDVAAPPLPPLGFELVERRQEEDFLLFRFRSDLPRWISPGVLAETAVDQGPALLFEPPQ